MSIVVRTLLQDEIRLDDNGKEYNYVLYGLVSSEKIPKFIWYWFKRYAKELGSYRVSEFHGLLCDYEIVSPSDKRFLIKKPGRNNNKLIERLAKEYDNVKD